ncbi:hypothetical protein ACRAWF_32975 [Streptomyces sp. L7]
MLWRESTATATDMLVIEPHGYEGHPCRRTRPRVPRRPHVQRAPLAEGPGLGRS